MPSTTIVDSPPPEQARMLAEVRWARYGYLLALHILLLCAAQRRPTEIAAVLFYSRSTVYRVVKVYRTGQLEGDCQRMVWGARWRGGRSCRRL